MGLFKNYINQTGKPEGFLGKMMIKGMNPGHAKLADWGMRHLTNVHPKEILEIGCGGGRNIGELLQTYPTARVHGVDHAALSVEHSCAYNAAAIASGRCTVTQGSVAALPFENESFELATAFETVYFWPGIVQCFGEVCRVLKPGGAFLIVNESNGEDATGKRFEAIIDGMHVYTAADLEAALKGAGFSQVTTYCHGSKPWITVLAEK